MKRNIQEPTITEEPNGRGQRIDHPAFAQIAAHRISGFQNLYGSDFRHQHFIRISIAPSRLVRDLSRDMAHASVDAYIEVDLSEAQWASFVSSMNVGSGTQCTLQRLNRESVPQLPDPVSRKEQFRNEAREKCEGALEELHALRNAIDAMNISQKAKDSLKNRAINVEARLTSSLPFVMEQFGEHMEQTVEKAKVEINAYATQTVMRAGIAALGGEGGSMPILSLGQPKDDSK